MSGKVVLAYSGGLDTSVCVSLLREKYGFERVVTVTVDVGQPGEEIADAEKRAREVGDVHYTLDVREEFVGGYIFPLIKANGCYEGYVLGTAVARPLIARKVVEVAEKEGADAVAHGCTGKGNDQMRFEAVFHSSRFRVVAPMRELNLTREWEIDYAIKRGIPVPVTREKPWSVDENLWSRSIEGGELEEPDYVPPDEIFTWTSPPSQGVEAEIVELGFQGGVPVSLNGEEMDGVTLIQRLNRLGGRHGVGRSDLIEDRMLGFKARENYEHPAATIILRSHRDLESLVLTREELKFKSQVDLAWSELAYQGLVDEPLLADLNAFIDKTQERVTGSVKLRLYCGAAAVVARSSPYALYNKELVSFDNSKVSQQDAGGCCKYHGFQARLYKRSSVDKL